MNRINHNRRLIIKYFENKISTEMLLKLWITDLKDELEEGV